MSSRRPDSAPVSYTPSRPVFSPSSTVVARRSLRRPGADSARSAFPRSNTEQVGAYQYTSPNPWFKGWHNDYEGWLKGIKDDYEKNQPKEAELLELLKDTKGELQAALKAQQQCRDAQSAVIKEAADKEEEELREQIKGLQTQIDAERALNTELQTELGQAKAKLDSDELKQLQADNARFKEAQKAAEEAARESREKADQLKAQQEEELEKLKAEKYQLNKRVVALALQLQVANKKAEELKASGSTDLNLLKEAREEVILYRQALDAAKVLADKAQDEYNERAKNNTAIIDALGKELENMKTEWKALKESNVCKVKAAEDADVPLSDSQKMLLPKILGTDGNTPSSTQSLQKTGNVVTAVNRLRNAVEEGNPEEGGNPSNPTSVIPGSTVRPSADMTELMNSPSSRPGTAGGAVVTSNPTTLSPQPSFSGSEAGSDPDIPTSPLGKGVGLPKPLSRESSSSSARSVMSR